MPTFWSSDFGASAQQQMQQDMPMSDSTNKLMFGTKRKQQEMPFIKPTEPVGSFGFQSSKRPYFPSSNGFLGQQPPAAFIKAYQESQNKRHFLHEMATTSSSPIDIAGCDNNGNQINWMSEEKSYTNTCVNYYTSHTEEKDMMDMDESMDCTQTDRSVLSVPKPEHGMRTPERQSPDTIRQYVIAGGYSPRQVQAFCRIPYTDPERCCGFRSEFY